MEQKQGILSWQLQNYLKKQKNDKKKNLPEVDFLD